MSSTDSIQKKDLYKCNEGSFERLNLTNYIEWKTNVKSMLKMMEAWEIVIGEEKMPTATPPAHSTRVRSNETENFNLQQPSHPSTSVGTKLKPSSVIHPTTRFRISSAVSMIRLRCGSCWPTSSTGPIRKPNAPSMRATCTLSGLVQGNESEPTVNDCYSIVILLMGPRRRYRTPS